MMSTKLFFVSRWHHIHVGIDIYMIFSEVDVKLTSNFEVRELLMWQVLYIKSPFPMDNEKGYSRLHASVKKCDAVEYIASEMG